jgi:hypothetical protein
MVSNGQAGDGSTIMVEMTPCNQTHSNENQPLVPNCQGLCDQKKQEVPDFCVDDAESSRYDKGVRYFPVYKMTYNIGQVKLI